MNWVAWALVTPGMIWLYVAILCVALALVVKWQGEQTDRGKEITYGACVVVAVRAVATSNSTDVLHVAAWSLASLRADLSYDKIRQVLMGAAMIQQRRPDLLPFDTGGEEMRALARELLNWPDAGDDLVNCLAGHDGQIDSELLDDLTKGLDAAAMIAIQARLEAVIVDIYATSLKARRQQRNITDHTAATARDALVLGARRFASWSSSRWGRALCFAAGASMVVSGTSSMPQVVGGGMLLLTALGLGAVSALKARADR